MSRVRKRLPKHAPQIASAALQVLVACDDESLRARSRRAAKRRNVVKALDRCGARASISLPQDVSPRLFWDLFADIILVCRGQLRMQEEANQASKWSPFTPADFPALEKAEQQFGLAGLKKRATEQRIFLKLHPQASRRLARMKEISGQVAHYRLHSKTFLLRGLYGLCRSFGMRRVDLLNVVLPKILKAVGIEPAHGDALEWKPAALWPRIASRSRARGGDLPTARFIAYCLLSTEPELHGYRQDPGWESAIERHVERGMAAGLFSQERSPLTEEQCHMLRELEWFREIYLHPEILGRAWRTMPPPPRRMVDKAP